ncbi:MAG: (2Fe-2S)-binding protein [Burkholderiales bacterium]
MSVEAAASRTIRFRLNGEAVSAQIGNHHTLVELLQRLGLGGARESCAQGLCGCCTVLVDGTAVSGCLYLAAFVDGAEVATIEQAHGDDRQGMLRTAQQARPDLGLDAVQRAFAACGAFQCGFCTPGFVLMSRQLLDANSDPSEDEIRHYLSGNLCRCAAYPEIVRAVQLAARMRAGQA